MYAKSDRFLAVVVAQLVEGLLQPPEVHSLNPVIGKINIEHSLSTVMKKTKNMGKEAGKGPFKNNNNKV